MSTKIYKYDLHKKDSGYCVLTKYAPDNCKLVINLSCNTLDEVFWLTVDCNKTPEYTLEECKYPDELEFKVVSKVNIMFTPSLFFGMSRGIGNTAYSDPLFTGTYDECLDYCKKSNNDSLFIKIDPTHISDIKSGNGYISVNDYVSKFKCGDEYADGIITEVDVDEDDTVHIHTTKGMDYTENPKLINVITQQVYIDYEESTSGNKNL